VRGRRCTLLLRARVRAVRRKAVLRRVVRREKKAPRLAAAAP
jgi:hypothetical protein